MKNYFSVLLLLSFFLSNAQDKKEETSQEFQFELNKKYADSTSSPLNKEDLDHFKGLVFFEIDSKYVIEATFVRTKREKIFKMETTTSRLPEYKKYGELFFSIEGKDFKLNVYQNIDLSKKKEYKDYLFLPFTDLTCGNQSYVGGRYIDLRIPKKDIVRIDFNKSYNPYCAYNPKYSCPIVPIENDLAIEIKAGVKKFHD
ncbi:DUF1684 domain-containing protein [Flavobacterium sp.]|uniref:DUF1684 domain-containing protein n=1 Tax=Flavobacterium sp. TaxID=239 RepID=UPI00286E34EC|nr:DUF1684 domain-containing protein [Flavobacterium sp.]